MFFKGFKFLRAVHPICSHTSSLYNLTSVPISACWLPLPAATGSHWPFSLCLSNKLIPLNKPSIFIYTVQPTQAGLTKAYYLCQVPCTGVFLWAELILQPGQLLWEGEEKGGPRVWCPLGTASCSSHVLQGGVPALESLPKHLAYVGLCRGGSITNYAFSSFIFTSILSHESWRGRQSVVK